MDTITHSKVQKIIKQLPEDKLLLAYQFLIDLAEKDSSEISSPQIDVMQLSLAERWRLMAEQAEKMAAHYKEQTQEREIWQGGDFLDEY